MAGRLAAIGRDVSGLALGQRVAAFPAIGCGRCEACAVGNWILCPAAERITGGFGQYVAIPAAAAVPLDDSLSAADGALVEPLTVSLYGVSMAMLQPGDRVLVLGAGTIALTAIYWARRLGAGRIVAMSRSPRRADMALAMGADAFVPYGEDELAEAVQALGGGADPVCECAGVAGMLAKAVGHARLMGKVHSLGLCMTPDALVPMLAGIRGVTLSFPTGYSLKDFAFTASTMLQGHVDPKIMISKTIGLEDFPAMFGHLLTNNTENKLQVAPN